MEAKRFYTSKTLWVNVVAVIAIVVQALTGNEIIDAEGEIAIVAVVNIVLRLLTKTGVTW